MTDRPLRILELFAGSKSFANAAQSLGHEVFTSDNDPAFETHYCVDIMDFDIDRLPWKPDVIWASPPCESFSVASIGKHWYSAGHPKTAKAEHGLAMLEKTIEIIKLIQPKYYVIENPRGMMRKTPAMAEFPLRHTVTYCQYGDTRMKPTDLWTNLSFWQPRAVCKNGAPCHVAAPRGSSTGTQGIKTYYERSIVPRELCLEMLRAIERYEAGIPTMSQPQMELAA